MGFTQLLLDRKKELNKEQTTSLNTILDASKRLNKLMNEVLNIQKVGKGNYQLNIESVNLLTLVNEIEKTFAPQINNKNISLDTSRCDFMFSLETDKSYLKQILINLISNAIKFNKDNGSIFVECKGGIYKPQVIIRDTGKGIHPEHIEKIFDPLERLDVFENIAGAGIGLTVTKQLADLLNIDIGVDSEIDQGTTITLTFS